MSEEGITVEEKAKAQGWTPQEEFRGDPDKWKSAEEFVAVGEKISAVQSERNDKLIREVSSLRGDIAAFKEIHSRELKAVKEDAYNRAVEKLQVKQREAIVSGDIEEFDKIEAKIKATPKPKIETAETAPQPSPEFVDWAARNAWYGGDVELTEEADYWGKKIDINQYSDISKFYKAVEAKVKKMNPDKFNGGQSAQSVEQPAGGVSPKAGGKTYKSLPADVKKVCDEYVARGLFKSKEDYAKSYYEE